MFSFIHEYTFVSINSRHAQNAVNNNIHNLPITRQNNNSCKHTCEFLLPVYEPHKIAYREIIQSNMLSERLLVYPCTRF